jgi:trimeric autotransporter adhesin
VTSSRYSLLATGLVACLTGLLGTDAARAIQPKKPQSDLDKKEFFLPELVISSSNVRVEQVLSQLPNRAAWQRFQATDRSRTGKEAVQGFVDPRSGVATNLMGAFPLIPGRGVGNRVPGVRSERVDGATVARAVQEFVRQNRDLLGIDVGQLGAGRAVQVTPDLWQVSIPQVFNGVPVRDARLAASISHGNLVVIGAETWGNVRGLSAVPKVSAARALEAGFAYAGGRSAQDVMLRQPTLEIVPLAPPEHQRGGAYDGPVGAGYRHRLVWTFVFRRPPDLGTFEAMVDAHSGEVIAFQDLNRYAEKQIVGGVYPLTNTGVCPTPQTCGTMQIGWPMPFDDTGFASPNNFTNSGGIYNYSSGTATTTLSGSFVDIVDNCGAINNTSAIGSINLGGVNNQHDCTSGGGSPGNTPASRSAFYEINKLAEQARGWLPSNTWLQAPLTANVNIVATCNAFWNGSSINFFRAGGGCRNTGEIGAVFDHEWGHGLDDNDAGGVLSNSSEGYADIAAIYRLQASCVGHGFFQTVNFGCGMTADGTGFNMNEDQVGGSHCDLDCSGVRDADWDRHADHSPDTALGFVCGSCGAGSGPCGRQVHCAAAPSRQAAWDLVARDLRGAPFNLDSQTAFIIGNKLFYQGSGNIGLWHSCSCGVSSDGCGATNAYMQWITADDDNGNLADGTPHMTAIHAAFDRHGIACAAPAPANSGCAGGPTAVPTLSVTSGNFQTVLSWGAVPGATRYWVFRTEGHAGCDFGKALIAETTTPGYTDTTVANGRVYSYNVVAAGISSACFSPASNCVTVTPQAPAPQIQVPGSVQLGATCPGNPSRGTLNVCNTGKSDLIVNFIMSSDPQFAATTPSAGFPVVISHDFCFPLEVTFQPSVSGAQTATLTIPSNDPVHPSTTVQVFANGTEADVRVTGSTDFGVASAWSPAEKVVSVCNTGACDLQVASASISCTDFKLIDNPLPAAVSHDFCLDLVVAFTPTLPGHHSCELTITTNDPDTSNVTRTLTARTPAFLSLHAGLAQPHGILKNVAKQGSTLNLDFLYPFLPRWAWDLRLGISKLDGTAGNPDTDIYVLSPDIRYTFNPSGTVRLFLNGGLGGYHFDPGKFEAGGSLGLGLNVPAGPRFAIEATYNYHWVFTASPTLRFSQAQLGMLMSF